MARRWWHGLPTSLKAFVHTVPPLTELRYVLRRVATGASAHDGIYDEAFCASVDQSARRSMEVIAECITDHFRPSSVLDVGCGTGVLLECLRSRQVHGLGLECSQAALRMCRSRGLAVQEFDLTKDRLPDGAAFDVVVSTEVAEHIHRRWSDRYASLLCQAGDTIVFTAATPGQGGTEHFNEQPHRYWIGKFSRRGFTFQMRLSMKWRAIWRQRGTAPWYAKNLMIFRRIPDVAPPH